MSPGHPIARGESKQNMDATLLLFIIAFAVVSTIALWFRAYHVDRGQGLFAFWICLAALPMFAWLHRGKCRIYLVVWCSSIALLLATGIKLFFT